MLYFLLFAGVFWVMPFSAYSIDIKGRVIDARTREALPFVNVTIYGKPDVGSATDIDGTFTITGVKPGIFRLVASYVGYKTTETSEYMATINNNFGIIL